MTDYTKNAVLVVLNDTHTHINKNQIEKADGVIVNGGVGNSLLPLLTNHIQLAADINKPCIMDWFVDIADFQEINKDSMPSLGTCAQLMTIKRALYMTGTDGKLYKRRVHALRMWMYNRKYSNGNLETQVNMMKIFKFLSETARNNFELPVYIVVTNDFLAQDKFSRSGDELQSWLSNMTGTNEKPVSWVSSVKSARLSSGTIDWSNLPRPASTYEKPYIGNASLCHFFQFCTTSKTAPWGDNSSEVAVPITLYQSPASNLYEALGFTASTDGTGTHTDTNPGTSTDNSVLKEKLLSIAFELNNLANTL